MEPLAVLGFMFCVCIVKDMIQANRIFALMMQLELNWFCNCLQPGLGLRGRWGQSEFCLLKKVSKSPDQVAPSAAQGEAEEREEWNQRAEKEALKTQDCCRCCREDGRDGGEIPGSPHSLWPLPYRQQPSSGISQESRGTTVFYHHLHLHWITSSGADAY